MFQAPQDLELLFLHPIKRPTSGPGIIAPGLGVEKVKATLTLTNCSTSLSSLSNFPRKAWLCSLFPPWQ
jgi:hypothetical protein